MRTATDKSKSSRRLSQRDATSASNCIRISLQVTMASTVWTLALSLALQYTITYTLSDHPDEASPSKPNILFLMVHILAVSLYRASPKSILSN